MMMSEREKHLLVTNRLALLRGLTDIQTVIGVLRQDYSLTQEMQDEILSSPIRDQQIAKLLDILARRPKKAFDQFLNALVSTHQEGLAILLNQEATQRLVAERGASYPLPVSGGGSSTSSPVHHANFMQSQQSFVPASVMAQNGVPFAQNNIQYVPMQMFAGLPAGMVPYQMPTSGYAPYGQFLPAGSSGQMFGFNGPVQQSSFGNNQLKTAQLSTDGMEKQMVSTFLAEIERPDTAVMNFTIPKTTEFNSTELLYPMHHIPRGRAVIISNSFFIAPHLEEREGAEFDVQNLSRLFKCLHFEVIVHSNKNTQEIRDLLNNERQMPHHYTANAFVLFLLTHGSQGFVFGTDGEKLSVDEITTMFDGTHCEALCGKPKLFFIQACQGKKRSFRSVADGPSNVHPTDDTRDMCTTSDAMSASTGSEDEVAVAKKFAELSVEDVPGYVPPLPKDDRHEKADMLISYATVKGYEAWRHSELGSWFVRSLIYVFSRQAHRMHLVDMLTEANFLMEHLVTQGTSKPYRQIAEKRDTLRKRLYFLPGYQET